MVHTDLETETSVLSLGGSRYYIIVYDDSKGISMIRFLQLKSDTFGPLTEMNNQLSNLLNNSVKRIKMDNGVEYTSKQF